MSNPFQRATDQLSSGAVPPSQPPRRPVVVAATSGAHPETIGSGSISPSHPALLPFNLSSYSAASAAAAGRDFGSGEVRNSSSSGGSSASEYGGGRGAIVIGADSITPPAMTRRMREFIPESKKDDEYWLKRQKNNEAAKRSREKRRANDAVMSRRIHELSAENKRLKMELNALRHQFGLPPSTVTSTILHATSTMSDSIASLSDDGQTLSSPPPPQRPLTAASLDMLPLSSVNIAVSIGSGVPSGLSSADSCYLSGSSVGRLPEQCLCNHATSGTASVSYATSVGSRHMQSSAYDQSSTSATLPPIANLYGRPSSSVSKLRPFSSVDHHGNFGCGSDNRSINNHEVLPLQRVEAFTSQSADTASIVIFSDVSSSSESDSYENDGNRGGARLLNQPYDCERPRRDYGTHQRGPSSLIVTEAPLNLTASSRNSQVQGQSFRTCSLDFHVASWRGKCKSPDDDGTDYRYEDRSSVAHQSEASVVLPSDMIQRHVSLVPLPGSLGEFHPVLKQPDNAEALHHCDLPSTRSLSLPSVEAVVWHSRLAASGDDNGTVTEASVSKSPDSHVPAENRHVRGGVPLKVWHKLAASRSDAAGLQPVGAQAVTAAMAASATAAPVHRSLSIDDTGASRRRFYDNEYLPPVTGTVGSMQRPCLVELASAAETRTDPVRQLWHHQHTDQDVLSLLIHKHDGTARAALPRRANQSPM